MESTDVQKTIQLLDEAIQRSDQGDTASAPGVSGPAAHRDAPRRALAHAPRHGSLQTVTQVCGSTPVSEGPPFPILHPGMIH